jgi:hypothetical protein
VGATTFSLAALSIQTPILTVKQFLNSANMLSVILLSVIMPSVIILTAFILSVIVPSVIMLGVTTMLGVIMLYVNLNTAQYILLWHNVDIDQRRDTKDNDTHNVHC